MESWPDSLATLGLEVSTGPVVPFRAQHYLINEANRHEHDGAVPLLWLQHVKAQEIQWPVEHFRNPQSIALQAQSARLLMPSSNYVLLRRFSAKEERLRLVAAPFLKDTFPFAFVGIENHLNYVHKRSGKLTQAEVTGLSAIYNTALIDRYFRIVNGHTQVNATELRRLPLPPLSIVQEIGQVILSPGKKIALNEVEGIATSILRKYGCLPDDLPNIEESNMAIKKLNRI